MANPYLLVGKAIDQLIETMEDEEKENLESIVAQPDNYNFGGVVIYATFKNSKTYGYAAYISDLNGHIEVDGF